MTNDGWCTVECPSCRAGAVDDVSGPNTPLTCRACSAQYPVRHTVPLMIKPADLADRVSQIKQNLSLQYIPDEALIDVLGAGVRYAYTRPGMGVEFGNLIGRFANFLEPPGGSPEPEVSSRLIAVTDMLCPTFAPGEQTTRTIRFKNTSATDIATQGQHPAHISYHLYDAKNRLIEFEGLRSAFPIPIQAGAELTVPVNVRTPKAPGAYRLVLCLVEEGLLWHPPITSIDVTVRSNPYPLSKPEGDSAAFDYPADFRKSIDFVTQALAGTPSPKILEVACGLYPVSAYLVPDGASVTAVDLCWAELQMASLIHNREGSNIPVQFVCADVDDLPFAPGGFDAVVICAALHHFPNPKATLGRLRRYLRPGGFLIVVREPASVNIADEGYLSDLKRGYNEQQFLFEEYISMLAANDFTYRHGQVDFSGSLKFVATINDSTVGASAPPRLAWLSWKNLVRDATT